MWKAFSACELYIYWGKCFHSPEDDMMKIDNNLSREGKRMITVSHFWGTQKKIPQPAQPSHIISAGESVILKNSHCKIWCPLLTPIFLSSSHFCISILLVYYLPCHTTHASIMFIHESTVYSAGVRTLLLHIHWSRILCLSFVVITCFLVPRGHPKLSGVAPRGKRLWCLHGLPYHVGTVMWWPANV